MVKSRYLLKNVKVSLRVGLKEYRAGQKCIFVEETFFFKRLKLSTELLYVVSHTSYLLNFFEFDSFKKVMLKLHILYRHVLF